MQELTELEKFKEML